MPIQDERGTLVPTPTATVGLDYFDPRLPNSTPADSTFVLCMLQSRRNRSTCELAHAHHQTDGKAGRGGCLKVGERRCGPGRRSPRRMLGRSVERPSSRFQCLPDPSGAALRTVEIQTVDAIRLYGGKAICARSGSGCRRHLPTACRSLRRGRVLALVGVRQRGRSASYRRRNHLRTLSGVQQQGPSKELGKHAK